MGLSKVPLGVFRHIFAVVSSRTFEEKSAKP